MSAKIYCPVRRIIRERKWRLIIRQIIKDPKLVTNQESLFLILIFCILDNRSIIKGKDIDIPNGQAHILGYLLNLRLLISHNSNLEELQVLAMDLQTLHVADDGIHFSLGHFAKVSLIELLNSPRFIDFGGMLEEKFEDVLITTHYTHNYKSKWQHKN